MENAIHTISIIGSGNVATHIASALYAAGYTILEVFSANPTNTQTLANKVNAAVLYDIKKIDSSADLYLFSISDNAYENILKAFPLNNKTLAHTAGSLSMEIFANKSNNYGVIYPFQTLSKSKEINFKEVPVLYCGSNTGTQELLKNIAERISNKVNFADDEQRKYIHISAVFACNFTNHMYALAKQITEQHNIDFSLLYPLIKETTEKALLGDPSKMQTGPAVRNDTNILDTHSSLLKDNTELQQLYTLLSNSILKHHTKNGEEL